MPTADDKIWYIRHVSLVPILFLSNTIVIITVVALPVGAAAFVSPMGGLLGLLSGLLFAWVSLYFRRVDIPWKRVAATPRRRRGYSVETSRGDAAAATWIFRGDES